MKQDYTMYIYKADRRTKSGERLVSTTVWQARTQEGMDNEVRGLAWLYPASKGYRFECVPTMKRVRNLMSGVEVEIPYDTPRSCDPSSELYWSM
jgi:hypothetical protein